MPEDPLMIAGADDQAKRAAARAGGLGFAWRLGLGLLLSPLSQLWPATSYCRWSTDVFAAKSDSPLFVVVHGTWNPGAQWAATDALLGSALLDAWPEAHVTQFQWSGFNSVRHRQAAAGRLALDLNKLTQKRTGPVVVLAHSHGGNIAAWASTKLNFDLAAAVFINTPFIQVLHPHSGGGTTPAILDRILSPSRGAFARNAWLFLHLLLVTFIVAAFALFLTAVGVQIYGWGRPAEGVSRLSQIPPEEVITPFGVGALVFFGSLMLFVRRAAWRLAEVTGGTRRILHELVVSAVGDEVAAAFGLAYLVQLVARPLTNFIAFALAAAYVPGALWVRSMSIPPTSFNWALLVGGYALLAGFLTFIVVGMLAHGMLQGLIGSYSPIGTSLAPLADKNVMRTHVMTVGWHLDDSMRHSSVLQARSTVDAIVNWLSHTGPLPTRANTVEAL